MKSASEMRAIADAVSEEKISKLLEEVRKQGMFLVFISQALKKSILLFLKKPLRK